MKKIKEFIKNIGLVIGTFIIYTISILLLSSFFSLFLKNEIIINIICYILSSAILLLIFRKDIISNFNNFKKNYKDYLTNGFKIYLIAYGFSLISNIILTSIVGNKLPVNEIENRTVISNNLIYAIFLMCFIAPFQEEILFRLNFKRLFKNKIVFSIVTGLIFGLMHLINGQPGELIYIFTYASLGIGLGYMYYDTKNIFTSMFFHFFNNGLSILFLLLAEAL